MSRIAAWTENLVSAYYQFSAKRNMLATLIRWIVTWYKMSRLMTKPTKWHVRPAKTQISLGIRPVWSEFSQSAWRKLGSLTTHFAQAKTLIRLGGCPGWSESSLGAQSFWWLSHEAAQICFHYSLTCLQRPIMESRKTGLHSQVVVILRINSSYSGT